MLSYWIRNEYSKRNSEYLNMLLPSKHTISHQCSFTAKDLDLLHKRFILVMIKSYLSRHGYQSWLILLKLIIHMMTVLDKLRLIRIEDIMGMLQYCF